MDLVGAPIRFKREFLGRGQKVLCAGQRVMVVVLTLWVDLGAGPTKDAEGVVGTEVDDREGDRTRPGLPCG